MTSSNQVLSEVEYNIVGKRPVRPDRVDKVTGRAQYGADVKLNGLLYGKVLRSPHPHARIRSIDTNKAEAVPGVKAVITAKDLPFRFPRGCRQNHREVVDCRELESVAGGSMTAAHRRHDMTDAVWERLRPLIPGGEANREDQPMTTAASSTPCAGFCAPALPGATCPRTTGTGRTPTAASAAGGTGASGPDCWKQSWMTRISNG